MITPGFEINYIDPINGAAFPNAWIVPMQFIINTNNDNLSQQVAFVVFTYNVFMTQDLYLAGEPPTFQRQVFTNALDATFLQYFGAALPTLKSDMLAYLAAVVNNPPSQ